MTKYFHFHDTKDYDSLHIAAGREIFFRLRGSEQPEYLIICFHGATNREKKSLPRFQESFPAGNNAAYLSISDPTLAENKKLRVGWYAGAKDFDLRQILTDILQQTILKLSPRRTVLFGSSAGGYAALWYAKHLPGSVSLVINPQTNILKYKPGHVKDYFSMCWPDLDVEKAKDDAFNCDVSTLYASNPEEVSTVLLSSPGDRSHFEQHVAPFLGKLGVDALSRTIFFSDFFGVMGHEESMPTSLIKRWFNAILISENTTPEAILKAYYSLAPTYEKITTARKATNTSVSFDKTDILIANLLRDHQLSQHTED